MDKEFYVYVYRDPLDGTPVYVGKGRGNRAISHTWLKSRTNDRLGKLVVNRAEQGHAMEPEIIAHCNEENALMIEQALIKYFGRAELGEGPLFNSTDGGDGVTNPSLEVRSKQRKAQETRWGTKKINFVNAFTNERFYGKATELAAFLGCSQTQVQKIFNDKHVHSVAGGWCLEGSEHLVNAYNFKYDFINELTKERFNGTIAELARHAEISASGVALLVSKSRNHAAGWVLAENSGSLRPLEKTAIGHIREIEFPWENVKAPFDSYLSWASMPRMIAFWREKLDADPSIGIKTVLKAMELPYPEKLFLYERAFKRCRDGEFDLVNNKYFLEFFDNFVTQHPELKEQLDFPR